MGWRAVSTRYVWLVLLPVKSSIDGMEGFCDLREDILVLVKMNGKLTKGQQVAEWYCWSVV